MIELSSRGPAEASRTPGPRGRRVARPDGRWRSLLQKICLSPTFAVSLLAISACGEPLGTCEASRDILTVRADYGDDGELDRVTEYSYDGGLLHSRETRGDFNERVDYTYDADEQLTREATDEGNDGTIDWVRTYTYDSGGQLLSERYEGAGPPETLTYSYDPHGRLVSACPEDGECLTYTYTYTYDDDRVSRMCENNGACTSYTYDEDGVLRQSVRTFENGSRVVEITTSRFDACGRPSSVAQDIREDWEANGQPNSLFESSLSMALDEDGNVVREERRTDQRIDYEEDGVIDYEAHTVEVHTFAYTYDGDPGA